MNVLFLVLISVSEDYRETFSFSAPSSRFFLKFESDMIDARHVQYLCN